MEASWRPVCGGFGASRVIGENPDIFGAKWLLSVHGALAAGGAKSHPNWYVLYNLFSFL